MMRTKQRQSCTCRRRLKQQTRRGSKPMEVHRDPASQTGQYQSSNIPAPPLKMKTVRTWTSQRPRRLSAPQFQAQLSWLADRPRLRRLKSTLLSKGAWQQGTRLEDLCHTHVSHKWLSSLGCVRGECLDATRPHHQRAEKTWKQSVWTGFGEWRSCGSFLDPQLEHGKTCSTAEATRGHHACVHAVVCGLKLADPGITTEPRGLTASQSRLHRRWEHEIQIALLRRRPPMTRAVLQNPSARAERLLTSIIDGALRHWGHVLPLDGGIGDIDHADSVTDTAIPDDDDDIASCASQSFVSLQPSRLLIAWFCPQHCRGTTDASALTSCVTSPLQLTCRLTQCTLFPVASGPDSQVVVRKEDNDTHIFDVLPLAASLHPHDVAFSVVRRPGHISGSSVSRSASIPISQQLARPLADLLTAIAALLAKRQPHSAPSLLTGWTTQQIVSEVYRILGQSTTSSEHTRRQLGSKSSSSASPCGVSSHLSSLNARSSHWLLPTCLLVVLKTHVRDKPFTVDSRPSHVGGPA